MYFPMQYSMSRGLLILMFYLLSFSALADQEGATITKMQGSVQIFSNPGKTAKGPAPHVLYEGMYYSMKEASVGDTVEQGNILRTAVGAMAKVVYENGDQVNVGSGTAYKISWDEGKEKSNNTSMDLLYGKFRSVVSKSGPRNNMEIKTANATMGIRGTDFFVAANGGNKTAEVTVIRGSVAVTPTTKNDSEKTTTKVKPIEVVAGSTAVVVAPAAVTRETASKKPAAPAIEVHKADKEELKQVEKVTVVKEEKKAENTAAAEQVKKLEAKAVTTTLQDIKHHDPKLYAQIEKNNLKTTEAINTTTVEKAIKAAPAAPTKPRAHELDDGRDFYKDYFKIVD